MEDFQIRCGMSHTYKKYGFYLVFTGLFLFVVSYPLQVFWIDTTANLPRFFLTIKDFIVVRVAAIIFIIGLFIIIDTSEKTEDERIWQLRGQAAWKSIKMFFPYLCIFLLPGQNQYFFWFFFILPFAVYVINFYKQLLLKETEELMPFLFSMGFYVALTGYLFVFIFLFSFLPDNVAYFPMYIYLAFLPSFVLMGYLFYKISRFVL